MTHTNGCADWRNTVVKLFEDFSRAGLAEFDAETRFKLLAAKGDTGEAMRILDKLDGHFERKP